MLTRPLRRVGRAFSTGIAVHSYLDFDGRDREKSAGGRVPQRHVDDLDLGYGRVAPSANGYGEHCTGVRRPEISSPEMTSPIAARACFTVAPGPAGGMAGLTDKALAMSAVSCSDMLNFPPWPAPTLDLHVRMAA
ncbi:hypothetical protein ABT298_26140 [Streptomyces sp. NPDC001034]|uniref:hypothetical protein n=1 Tax=Streptomyces sp. NPDC001034 TaxID=3154375 RepID=UPI003328ABA6